MPKRRDVADDIEVFPDNDDDSMCPESSFLGILYVIVAAAKHDPAAKSHGMPKTVELQVESEVSLNDASHRMRTLRQRKQQGTKHTLNCITEFNAPITYPCSSGTISSGHGQAQKLDVQCGSRYRAHEIGIPVALAESKGDENTQTEQPCATEHEGKT